MKSFCWKYFKNTEQLSYKTNNLIIAEATINFLLDALKDQGSSLAMQFYASIRDRIQARRDGVLVALLLYLKNPDFVSSDKHFPIVSKSAIQKLGVELLRKYFVKEPTVSEASEVVVVNEFASPQTSLRDRLQLSLNNYISVRAKESVPENLKREFTWFEKNKTRTTVLENLYSALLTIQPTSTQTERNFSVSSNVMTKQRKRMLDRNLSATVFVKSFFLNK
jgi:hypothetical protein